MKQIYTLFLCLSFLWFGGCIENDLPYPTIRGEIEEFAIQGMTSVKIDDASAIVSVKVVDTLDLKDLRVEKLVVTEGMTVIPDSSACKDFVHFPDTGFVSLDSLPNTVNTRMNFKQPVSILLRLYQDYPWTIKVEHDIQQSADVVNQVGEPLVDTFTRNMVIYADSAKQPSLKNIQTQSLQLGSSIAHIEPEPTSVKDFTRPRIFLVTAFGETEEWTVSVRYPSADMQSSTLSAWSKRAYIEGKTKNGDVSVKYRTIVESTRADEETPGESEWEYALSDEIVINEDGTFIVTLTHLKPGRSYEYQLTVDGKAEKIKTFETEPEEQLPNLSFDDWYQDGKIWYPNKDLSSEYYFGDSGNKGTSIANSNPTISEKKDVVKGSALRMASTNVVIKFAAGNIYSGSFYDVIGTKGALLDFGRPYTSRPSALKGYYKYTSGIINFAGSKYESMIGQKDSCHIYIALFKNWTKPFRVNSVEETFVDISWNNEDLIAFGELKTDQSNSEYKEFRIPIKYKDYATKPTYIVMVASASKYGDYFTGSDSSVLLLDECELVFE
ncbi:MAG: PCMD domain-containing protein [Parabacteroides sp.]|nr:PCMD domain-containing protein [Parabacteroides sp.]